MRKDSYETLHSHTTDSDGLLTHKQALKFCEKLNIGVLAFTDHDSIPKEKTIKILRKDKFQTKWIVGIEVSSGWPLDLGGGVTGNLHLVGLFVDPTNHRLIEHCKKAKSGRIERMSKMVKNLKGLGFKISQKDCLKASGGESVARPHIVKALTYYPENKKVIEKLLAKMEKGSSKDPEIKKRYDEMAMYGEAQYPYYLFLSERSFIPGIYVDYPYYSDFDNSVSLIRQAGGLAFLAHWGTCKYKINKKYLEDLFKNDRLDGAEVVYGLFNYDAGVWEQQEKELTVLKKIIKRHKKLMSGGADAHTTEDFEQFSKEKWYSKRTIGMSEEIIKSGKVDTTWSSFK